MYSLLVKLMVLAALLQLGISLADWERCSSRGCLTTLATKTRPILKIRWKPISLFPEEAKRFKK